jgi:polyisoprenoid-binding protein YceI
MKATWFAAGALALAVGPAWSQAAAPAWTVDKAASRVGFRAAMSGTAFEGRFTRYDARINFDPANLKASRISAVIDVASASTGDATRDEALPSSDWFAVKTHPQATFVSRAIMAAGPGRYVASGDLTLRGVKRAVNLPFTLVITGNTAKANGSLALDRTAFGVGQGEFKTGAMVDTKVTVTLALSARRAA